VARTPLVVAGMILLVAGGGAVGYALTRKATGGMTPELTRMMEESISQLDADIQSARSSVKSRAETLSQVGEVRSSIGTDADTTKERLGKEIGFKPQDGEVLTLSQQPKGGALQTLFMLPADGMQSVHAGAEGAYAELTHDMLLITQVAKVETSQSDEAAKAFTGFVTVSRPLSLQKATAGLTKEGVTGQLVVENATFQVGKPPADAVTQERPLRNLAGAKFVAMIAPAANATPTGVLAGGGGAAALGLVLVIVGMMGGTGGTKKSGATQLPSANAYNTNYQTAQTQLSTQMAASDPTTGISPGAMVGRWRIVKRIGSGGMADVYLAQATGEAGFEKLVALKVMHPHLARNQRAVDHFLDEARLAARVHHPNVVGIQDLGKVGNDYVIAMEYIEGVDLDKLLAAARAAQKPVPVNVGLGILCKICDGLNAAHTAVAPDGTQMNIIHRDVKSANVLVSRQGAVKVVDFGIAKAATQSHLTVAGETKGTPSMMAPEQRVGEQVDVRADVYSVAAVAFELLTNNAVNLDLAALAHLGVENWPHLPAPTSLRPELPPELDSMLLTAMSFDRTRRPPSCSALEDMLEGVMKRYGMTCSDKEIARWVDSELSRFPSDQLPASTGSISKPSGFA